MTSFRGFIAIDIEPTSAIIAFENKIAQTGADVKLVDPQNIHITLKFLGDVEEQKIDPIEQIMNTSVEGISPFSITLMGTGVFPNENYIKVIWIGIQGAEQIKTIATSLDERLSKIGFKREQRSLSPHLTIGRVKTVKNKQALMITIRNHEHLEFSEQKIPSIKLKKSQLTPQGPIYTTIKEIEL